jgi:Rrf2 family nitric oxide-sensitive transcriptional repressor
LTKVVHRLGQAGDIETLRGRGGGLRLARPAQDIRVGDVVRRTEDMCLVPCADGGTCLLMPSCVLKHALDEASAAFLAVLDRYTLADLAATPLLTAPRPVHTLPAS